MELKLDRSGAPVMIALPEQDTPTMADDPQLREMTCDPKFRRVLITDGRSPVGQTIHVHGIPITIVGTIVPKGRVLGQSFVRRSRLSSGSLRGTGSPKPMVIRWQRSFGSPHIRTRMSRSSTSSETPRTARCGSTW